MITPCEIAVKSVIPAVKAMVAKGLVEKHGLKQNEVADLLGISQSAVSKYTRELRGRAITLDNVQEIQAPINNIITLIASGTYQREEFLKLLCQACITIREKGLMCGYCQRSDPRAKIEECTLCTSHDPHNE